MFVALIIEQEGGQEDKKNWAPAIVSHLLSLRVRIPPSLLLPHSSQSKLLKSHISYLSGTHGRGGR